MHHPKGDPTIEVEEVNLYLATVGVLREHGVTDASLQVNCELRSESSEYIIRANQAVRPVLAPRLGAELHRNFDVQQTQWTLSPREANKLISRWAVL